MRDLIESPQHYEVARRRASEFARAIADLQDRPTGEGGPDLAARLERDGFYFQFLELEEALRAYEAAVTGLDFDQGRRRVVGGSESPPDLTRELGPLLVVLTGPSGAGKDSVIVQLAELGREFDHIVTWTTRDLRKPHEREGFDYHTTSEEEFQAKIESGFFLEFNKYGEDYYGSPRESIASAITRGRDAVIRVDVNGASRIKELLPGAVTIFIAPPSVEGLRRRMEKRGDPSEQIERRLRRAERDEMPAAADFDYLVVNDGPDAAAAAARVRAIMTAERLRTRRIPIELEDSLATLA
jgi:guanylate kinase